MPLHFPFPRIPKDLPEHQELTKTLNQHRPSYQADFENPPLLSAALAHVPVMNLAINMAAKFGAHAQRKLKML
jgi:hypothetical protein